MKPYILIPSAQTEKSYIEKKICSVIAQIVFPKKKVLFSNGCANRSVVDDRAVEYS